MTTIELLKDFVQSMQCNMINCGELSIAVGIKDYLSSIENPQPSGGKSAEEMLKYNAFMNGGNTDAEKSFYKMGFNDATEQYANQQPVQGYSREDIEKAVNELAIESTAPDKETPDWMKSDIRRGIIRGIAMAQQPVNDGWVSELDKEMKLNNEIQLIIF